MRGQLSSGDGIKIYNERGEFAPKAHVTDDVPPGVVWIRDGWFGLNHLTSGDAVLTGDALSLFPFSVGQADYGAKAEVARCYWAACPQEDLFVNANSCPRC